MSGGSLSAHGLQIHYIKPMPTSVTDDLTDRTDNKNLNTMVDKVTLKYVYTIDNVHEASSLSYHTRLTQIHRFLY